MTENEVAEKKAETKDKPFFQTGNNAYFPYFILTILLILTTAVTYIFYNSAKNKDALRFSNQTAKLHNSIENKLALYTTLLKGGRGFVEASPVLDRKTFEKFTGAIDFEKDYRGVQSIGYLQIIQPDELSGLEQKMRAEGAENFHVFPSGEREIYHVVLYVEPLNERTKASLGFDMTTEKNRLDAIDRARDTGELSMTGKIIPLTLKEADKQFGFNIYLPVYKNNDFPSTVEARRQNIRGYVFCPFRANIFLGEVQRDENINDIGIKIFDMSKQAENLLSETNAVEADKFSALSGGTQQRDDEINIGGRKWIAEFTTLPNFNEQSSSGWSPLIFFIGLVSSFLLFAMSLREAKAAEKVKKTAEQLYDAQQDCAVLFENEKQARSAAEKANSAKDEFIAIVSHELKTPLNAIGGWTRILKSTDLTENTREIALHKINKNLRLQTALIEQLLNYSEIVSNSFHLNQRKIIFSDLAKTTCEDILPLFEDKKIDFQYIDLSSGCAVNGDPEKLKMVIYNFFSNALKFTPEGGKIEALVSQSKDFAELAISDNGRGIRSEFIPHVFEQFRQADNPNTRDYGGLGIGMTIAAQIVKLHHGEITVESDGEGRGTTFIVKLPCVENV